MGTRITDTRKKKKACFFTRPFWVKVLKFLAKG